MRVEAGGSGNLVYVQSGRDRNFCCFAIGVFFCTAMLTPAVVIASDWVGSETSL